MMRCRPSIATGRASGFTLIEVLVGLALMGLASALLLAAVRMVGLISSRERATSAGLDEVVAAQRVLRMGAERLRPMARVDTVGSIVDFRGTAGVLRYIAPPLEREAPNALQRFRLSRTANGDLVLFSVSTRKLDVDESSFDLVGWTPTTLLRGTSHLSISYRGKPLGGGNSQWLDRWWDRPRPPELIRIRVEFPAGDIRHWPDLVIRPRATVTSNCLLDGTYQRCGEGG